ncbi:unannotated protein [freshwater metagenome]|uniref:Unannotated protein n=1 Tax=freshwater metagenome TaxID=449393 RepID=A0A6J6VLT8_9ZZZZ
MLANDPKEVLTRPLRPITNDAAATTTASRVVVQSVVSQVASAESPSAFKESIPARAASHAELALSSQPSLAISLHNER